MLRSRLTKILLAVLTIVIMVLAIFEVRSFVNNKNSSETKKSATREIGPYTIYTEQTDFQKELEPQLVAALESGTPKKISTTVSKYFISDYFTLANKKNSKMVGGIGFVFEPARETFRTNAIDSYYSDLQQYIKTYGKENLPLVTSVKTGAITKVDNSNVRVAKKSELQIKSVYDVAVTWEYEKNEKNKSDTLVNKGKVRFVKATDENWYIYEFIAEEGQGVDYNEGY